MKKGLRLALAGLFVAAGLLACGHASLAGQAQAQNAINQKATDATGLTFRDGAPLSLDEHHYEITTAYRSVPTKTYADGEVELAVVSIQRDWIISPETRNNPFVEAVFYHNTQNGDPHFYQLSESLHYDERDRAYLKGANGFRLYFEEIKGGAAAWTKALKNGSRSLVLLPKVQKLEYAFEVSGGRLVVLTADSYNNTGGSGNYTLYVGKPGEMKSYKVTEFMRLRDGGTTSLKAEREGQTITLFSPMPLHRDKHAAVNGEKVQDITSKTNPATLGIRGLGGRDLLKSPMPQ